MIMNRASFSIDQPLLPDPPRNILRSPDDVPKCLHSCEDYHEHQLTCEVGIVKHVALDDEDQQLQRKQQKAVHPVEV